MSESKCLRNPAAMVSERTCHTRLVRISMYKNKPKRVFDPKYDEFCVDCQGIKPKKNKPKEIKDKWCGGCKKRLPADLDNFDRATRSEDGLTNDCKVCRKEGMGSVIITKKKDVKKKKQSPIQTEIEPFGVISRIFGKYEFTGMELGKLVDTKQAAYGDSFSKAGNVMKELYPDGIKPEQYKDALAVVRIIDKLFRIATKKDALGENPFKDIAGYGLLGAGINEDEI